MVCSSTLISYLPSSDLLANEFSDLPVSWKCSECKHGGASYDVPPMVNSSIPVY